MISPSLLVIISQLSFITAIISAASQSTSPSKKPTTKWPSTIPTTTAPVSLKLCQFSGYCVKSSDCVTGNKCNIQSVYYSQCMPDPSTYTNETGRLSNYGGKCSSKSQCADPGAYCDLSATFPQCKQPVSSTELCIDAKSYPSLSPTLKPSVVFSSVPTRKPTAALTLKPTVSPTKFSPTFMPSSVRTRKPTAYPTLSPTFMPTSLPTVKPTSVPTAYETILPTTWTPTCLPSSGPTTANPTFSPSSTQPSNLPTMPSAEPTTKWPSAIPTTTAPVSLKLCQFSGYCVKSSDCITGNKCNIQSVYYSQCMPDPSTYTNETGRLSNYGGKCSSKSQCADPGAYCDLSATFPQCKQPVSSTGLCIDANGYAKPTANPTFTPTIFSPTFSPSSVSTNSSLSMSVPSNKPSEEPSLSPTEMPTAPTEYPTGTHYSTY